MVAKLPEKVGVKRVVHSTPDFQALRSKAKEILGVESRVVPPDQKIEDFQAALQNLQLC